ncbi:MAG: glycosyltransferase [Candidatus Egerieousia sp.]|nr:glycosyltransferase [Candidatus Egerieousia sp.]
MNKKVYFYTRNTNSPGVTIILNSIVRSLLPYGIEGHIIDNIDNISRNELVIPYGTYECYELLKTSHSKELALLVDYYSYGCLNKIFFYLKRLKLNYKDFYYSIISYLRYGFKDLKVAKSYAKVMMVSLSDIQKLTKKTNNSTYLLCKNCVKIQERDFRPYNGTPIKLGIIAHWTFISVDETRWFIDDVFSKLRLHYPNIELVIAGRGNAKIAERYFNKDGVKFIGEVSRLDDFFDNIDIYVATVPKGCGILNKLLDAFSYKVFSIGIKPSFSAFSDLRNGYLICETIKEYENAIWIYMNKPDEVQRIVNNAYNYVLEFHTDEEKNYESIVKTIVRALQSS